MDDPHAHSICTHDGVRAPQVMEELGRCETVVFETEHGYSIEVGSQTFLLAQVADQRHGRYEMARNIHQGALLFLSTCFAWPEETRAIDFRAPEAMFVLKTRVQTMPEQMDEDHAELLGLICSGGALYPKEGALAFTTQSQETMTSFCALVKAVYDLPIRYLPAPKHGIHAAIVMDRTLVRYLQHIGVGRGLPWPIREGTQSIVRAFVQGVAFGGNLMRSASHTTITVEDAALAAELQILLLKFGIACVRRSAPGSNNRTINLLRFDGKSNLQLAWYVFGLQRYRTVWEALYEGFFGVDSDNDIRPLPLIATRVTKCYMSENNVYDLCIHTCDQHGNAVQHGNYLANGFVVYTRRESEDDEDHE